MKLSISFVQLGYARVAARVGTAWPGTLIEGTGPRANKWFLHALFFDTRFEPPACVVAGLGETHLLERNERSGLCPANTNHTKLHLYHITVVLGPPLASEYAEHWEHGCAKAPHCWAIDCAYLSGHNRKHPMPLGNQPLGGVGNGSSSPRCHADAAAC